MRLFYAITIILFCYSDVYAITKSIPNKSGGHTYINRSGVVYRTHRNVFNGITIYPSRNSGIKK